MMFECRDIAARKSRADSKLLIFHKPILILGSLLASLAYFYSQTILNEIGFTNSIFVDGQTWLEATIALIEGEMKLSDIRSSGLMFLIFIPFVFLFGSVGGLFANHIFLVALFWKNNLYTFGFRALLFFPFFFLASQLPGKELLSLLVTAYFVYSLVERKLLLSCFLVLVQFFIRDGIGIAFFIIMSAIYFGSRFRVYLFIIFVSALILDKYLFDFQAYFEFFVFERTIGFFDGIEWQPYMIRVFAGMTNLGSRFTLMSPDGFFSLTGVSLMLAGVGVFMACLLSLYKLFYFDKFNEGKALTSFLMIGVLLLTSVSPLIQPRYLIPVAFVYLLSGYTLLTKAEIYISFIISVVILTSLRLYYVTTVGLPEIEAFSISKKLLSYSGSLL